MRKLAHLLSASILSVGIVHCVGDGPSATNPDGQGDASSGDDGSIGTDGAPATDGSTTTDSGPSDAGADAAGDSCFGHIDCPNQIAENAKLQIWLRGGFGETCTGGHLVSWADQSGKGNNATAPTASDGGTGIPAQCGVATINYHDVVTFTAPPPGDAGTPLQFIDGTLDTKLGFLPSSDYTFFVVHQRALDTNQALLSTDDTFLVSLNCGKAAYENAFFFGFNPVSGGFGEGYYQGCSRAVAAGDSFGASHVDVSEIVFAAASGHVLYVNGAQVYKVDSGGTDLSPVAAVGRGAIGRGTDTFNDDRFHGQIAEIIGFSAALSNPDRTAVESYLKRQWALSF